MTTIGSRLVILWLIDVVYSNSKAAEMEVYCTLYVGDWIK